MEYGRGWLQTIFLPSIFLPWPFFIRYWHRVGKLPWDTVWYRPIIRCILANAFTLRLFGEGVGSEILINYTAFIQNPKREYILGGLKSVQTPGYISRFKTH